jgi:hypothetical protein
MHRVRVDGGWVCAVKGEGTMPVVSAFNKKQKCGHTCARCPCLRIPVVVVMRHVHVVGGGVCVAASRVSI